MWGHIGKCWDHLGKMLVRDIETCWKNMEMGGNCVQKQKNGGGEKKNTLRDTIQKWKGQHMEIWIVASWPNHTLENPHHRACYQGYQAFKAIEEHAASSIQNLPYQDIFSGQTIYKQTSMGHCPLPLRVPKGKPAYWLNSILRTSEKLLAKLKPTSVYLFVYLYLIMHKSIYLYLFIYSIYLSVCLSFYLSIFYLSIFLSICLSVDLSIPPSLPPIHPSISLSLYLFI